MGVESYLPDKKSIGYSIISFFLGAWAKDRISGYINKKLHNFSEKVGENIAKNIYQQNSNPTSGTSQDQYNQRPAIDYAQQLYNAFTAQTEAIKQQTSLLEKLPDKIAYRVEKTVEKTINKTKKK